MGDESFDVCQGDRKKKAEFKKMSNKEKDALKQPFVENEFAEEFRHGGWTKIAQSIKPARLSDQHLSGQQVLQLMNDSCKEFNEGGYVALSKDTQIALFSHISNEYKNVCLAAYAKAMESLEGDAYKVPIGELDKYHHENQFASTSELKRCFETGILSIRNNEALDTVKKQFNATLRSEIGTCYEDIIRKNNNKIILPPWDPAKPLDHFPDDRCEIASVILGRKYVDALKYLCSDYKPQLGKGRHALRGYHGDVFWNTPNHIREWDRSLNSRNFFDSNISGKWDRHYSRLNVVPFGHCNFWGVECSGLKWKGSLRDVQNGIFNGERISQNQAYSSSFTVSKTNGEEMKFDLRAGHDNANGGAGISLNHSETQSLTQSYSYGYHVAGVEYITFKATADISLSLNRKTFVYARAKKSSLGTEGEKGCAGKDTKRTTFELELQVKVPACYCRKLQATL
eukprot:783858_1